MEWRDAFKALGDAIIAILAAGLIVCLIGWAAHARPGPQWSRLYNDPERNAWFGKLMQPDNPQKSCCGESDAYYSDSFEVDPKTGEVIAIITDERDNDELNRPPIPVGTRLHIPKSKMNNLIGLGNPTGHGIVFVTPAYGYNHEITDDANQRSKIMCYIMPGGV